LSFALLSRALALWPGYAAQDPAVRHAVAGALAHILVDFAASAEEADGRRSLRLEGIMPDHAPTPGSTSDPSADAAAGTEALFPLPSLQRLLSEAGVAAFASPSGQGVSTGLLLDWCLRAARSVLDDDGMHPQALWAGLRAAALAERPDLIASVASRMRDPPPSAPTQPPGSQWPPLPSGLALLPQLRARGHFYWSQHCGEPSGAGGCVLDSLREVSRLLGAGSGKVGTLSSAAAHAAPVFSVPEPLRTTQHLPWLVRMHTGFRFTQLRVATAADIAASQAVLSEAARLRPADCVAPLNLSWMLLQGARLREARDILLQLLERRRRVVTVNSAGQKEEREEYDGCVRSALQTILFNLGTVYAEDRTLEHVREGRRVFLEAARVTGDNWHALAAAFLFPSINADYQADTDTLRDESRQLLIDLSRSQAAEDGCLRLPPDRMVRGIPEAPSFLPYLGGDYSDDRWFMESIGSLLRCNFGLTARFLRLPRSPGPIRIVVVSSFFSTDHPHAQLLSGVLRSLPRDVFAPVVVHTVDEASSAWTRDTDLNKAAMGAPRYVQKSLPSRAFRDPAVSYLGLQKGGVVFLNPTFEDAFAGLAALEPDILIFGDIVSEGLNYALTMNRIARIQCTFWGNPISSGMPDTMDFFLSAKSMEDAPPATMFGWLRSEALVPAQKSEVDPAQTQYTERLIRLPGIGFSYQRSPMPPPSDLCQCPNFDIPNPVGCEAMQAEAERRSERSLPVPVEAEITTDWIDMLRAISGNISAATQDAQPIVLGCPQSLFKLTPAFDAIIARIMRALPNAVLLMMEERKILQTLQYKERIQVTMASGYDPIRRHASNATLGDANDVTQRIRWVPRLPGNRAFLSVLSCVDILLHPFPYDGSRTAVDGLELALPMVTLPGKQLRGRMGNALYNAIGMGDLVAHSEDEYVNIAIRLAKDDAHRLAIIKRLQAARPLAFDSDIDYEGWRRFLREAFEEGIQKPF
jgi:hypothetical protein